MTRLNETGAGWATRHLFSGETLTANRPAANRRGSLLHQFPGSLVQFDRHFAE